MAEVGLLPFARIALQVAKAVLPRYRSRFSKHQFTQPQLLAILCLMRYEDWTFREAEVRLGEHRELRQVLGLSSVPDFTTLYRFLRRLDDQTIDKAVGETVRRLRGVRRKEPTWAWTRPVWRKERSVRSLSTRIAPLVLPCSFTLRATSVPCARFAASEPRSNLFQNRVQPTATDTMYRKE